MFSFRFLCGLFLLAALVSGCASAEKRFNQGLEMETRGQYESAMRRYVQALEKDPSLGDARIRVEETGHQAMAERLQDASDLEARGDQVAAANQYHGVDAIVARARTVGVRLTVPVGYAQDRRAVFDEAFESLVDRGALYRDQGRWQDGLNSFRQAQGDFEPTLDQRNRALAEESALLVQWSEYEYQLGHLRKTFEVAAHVQDLEWSPRDLSVRASQLMENSLAEGEIELIVLPVQASHEPGQGGARNHEIASLIESTLQEGPWRQPPPFIALHEPLAVGGLADQAGLLDGDYRPATLALILQLADADYAAYLQILHSTTMEFDVKSKTHKVKKRTGEATTFVEKTGKRRIQAEARVVIADGRGHEIADVIVTGSGTTPFARGEYRGRARDLNLESRHVDLFDRFVLERQERDAIQALVNDLAAGISGAVFRPTLAQVP